MNQASCWGSVLGDDMGKQKGQYEEQIKSLILKMTLEEKVGQLRQCGPSLVGAFDVSFDELLNMMFDGRISKEEFDRLMGTAKQDYHEEDLRQGKIGSYNGIADAATVNRLQKIAVEETRLGIPLLFGYDVIHGFRSVTPIPLAESCSWDEKLWEETARMAAQEATAAGIHMTFAPMVDVAKDARWGRISEGAGEDVLLNGRYGAAKVRGFQGDDLSCENSMVACVKHFAAYGAVESGRDYNRVDMSTQKLFEEYLPSYKMCIDAGARAIMPAFNDINGVPCTVNSRLLLRILRKDWGFDGVTVSDSNAIAECVNHGIAADKKDAAEMALESGMDIDMSSECYHENLVELAKDGKLDEKALDRAVADVLRIKFELGLFEHPYRTSEEKEKKVMLTCENRELARKAAQESMVLLKNDPKGSTEGKVLPLAKGTRLGIFGSLASQRSEMTGAWAIGAKGEDCVSLVDACEQRGIPYECGNDEAPDDVATSCDVLLCVLGEKKDESGEAACKADISLPHDQVALFEQLLTFGKPVVVILFNGRPLAIPEMAEKASAILEAWHPGIEAGNAILDLLFGDVNPSGKLTTSFPYTSGQCPLYYAHINTGRPGGKSKFTSRYLDIPNDPVYPFGFGLSYTSYSYTDPLVKKTKDGHEVSVKICNEGDQAGCEIVQCYVQIPVGKRVRPVRELKGFERVFLEPHEEKTVRILVRNEDVGYYDEDMNYVVEKDGCRFFIGGNVKDAAKADLIEE